LEIFAHSWGFMEICGVALTRFGIMEENSPPSASQEPIFRVKHHLHRVTVLVLHMTSLLSPFSPWPPFCPYSVALISLLLLIFLRWSLYEARDWPQTYDLLSSALRVLGLPYLFNQDKTELRQEVTCPRLL
jgi:hypothetical protein